MLGNAVVSDLQMHFQALLLKRVVDVFTIAELVVEAIQPAYA